MPIRVAIYRGRISGFSAGTGAATALLPPENATGNFVKVVQRLPVRIDLVDGIPADAPLFVGLSVEPLVEVHRDRLPAPSPAKNSSARSSQPRRRFRASTVVHRPIDRSWPRFASGSGLTGRVDRGTVVMSATGHLPRVAARQPLAHCA